MNDETPRWLVVAAVLARTAALVLLSLLALFLIFVSLEGLYSDLTLRIGGATKHTWNNINFLAIGSGLAWWTYARGWKKLRRAP